MTTLPEAPPRHRPIPRPTPPPRRAEATRIGLYGDLTCPWSYLASRRAALLAADGVEVDWWMVEHERPTPGRGPGPEARLEAARRDLERVTRRLLHGETLPHAVPATVPHTRPAVSGYAEAYLADVAVEARRLLFEAFWTRGADLGNARLVRALLADTLRRGRSQSELVREWGFGVDVTGAPVTLAAWRLVRRWREGWSSGGEVVPVLLLQGGRRLLGVDAVEWLGAEVVRRGIDLDLLDGVPERHAAPKRDLVDLAWTTQHGNRWMQARRAAKTPDLLSRLRPWV